MINDNLDLSQWPCPIDEKDIVVYGELAGNPVSKARARIGKYGNFYTPKDTVNYENQLKWIMRSYLKNAEPDRESFFGVRAVFYRDSRQRIDCDNLMKCIFDAGNELVYKDDKQITEEFGKLYLAHPNPRVKFLIYKVKDTIPKKICPHCGKEFFVPPSLQRVKFCSNECKNGSRTISLECKNCHKDYSIPQSMKGKGLYCSRRCSAIGNGKKKSALFGPKNWICGVCGNHVSRKEYTRCIVCFVKSRKEVSSNYWSLRKAVA